MHHHQWFSSATEIEVMERAVQIGRFMAQCVNPTPGLPRGVVPSPLVAKVARQRRMGSWKLGLALRRVRQELSCHAHQDLGDGGRRAPPTLMKAVEDRE